MKLNKNKGFLQLILAALMISAVSMTVISCDTSGDGDDGDSDGSGGTNSGETCTVTGMSASGTYSGFNTAARGVLAEGNYAYVATYTYSGDYGGLAVIDVSSKSSPSKVGSYYPSSSSTSLYSGGSVAKYGDSVFIDGGSVRMFVEINVSTPSSPSLKYQYNGDPLSTLLYASGGTLYVASNKDFSVKAYATASEYTSGGSFTPSTVSSSKYFSQIVGNDSYVFVVHSDLNVYILKASDLSLVYSYPLSAAASIDVDSKYMYVRSSTNLDVVNIETPTAPVKEGTITLSASGRILVRYNCAFIVNDTSVQMIDVSKKSDPKLITTFSGTMGDVNGISISDDYLYTADGGGGSGKLRIFQIIK